MKQKKSIAILAALLALGAWTGRAAAQAEENSLRVGVYFISYHAKADDISGPFVPPGVNLDIKNTSTLYLAGVHRLNENFDIELAFGNPPKTETVGKGPATLGSAPFDGQVIATAKWFSPTVLVEYRFLEESSRWQPYAGIGINYTHFYDVQSTDAGNAAQGGPTKLTLSDSVGPAVTLGVGYKISGPWHAYASYNYAYVKSKLKADTSGVERTTTINFNPTALVVSVGYSF